MALAADDYLPDWKNALVGYEGFFDKGQSPSMRFKEEGYALGQELAHRWMGCHVIQRAGRLLKMYACS